MNPNETAVTRHDTDYATAGRGFVGALDPGVVLLTQLMALLDQPDPNFAIVTP